MISGSVDWCMGTFAIWSLLMVEKIGKKLFFSLFISFLCIDVVRCLTCRGYLYVELLCAVG